MERLNEKLSTLMETLSNIMAKRGDRIKSLAYKRAHEAILSLDRNIYTVDELKNVSGIGASSLAHMREYLEKGTLEIIEAERLNPENILSDIYGVGPKKAKELVQKGVTSIAQLRKRQDELLNKVQKVGLQYYEDILERIPRSEIDKYNDVFKAAVPPTAKYEIVGSYRRGAADSGDIDVIITSENKLDFQNFIDFLISKHIILEVLSRGDSKCLVIARISTPKYARRVDFLYTSPQEYPFAVLYFTGSKGFNTVMRGHALKQGYSLNEHELTVKSNGEKIQGKFIEEKDIFDFLQLQYKTPGERVDGRMVIPKIQSEKTVLKSGILEVDSKHGEVDSEIDILKKKLDDCNQKLLMVSQPIVKVASDSLKGNEVAEKQVAPLKGNEVAEKQVAPLLVAPLAPLRSPEIKPSKEVKTKKNIIPKATKTRKNMKPSKSLLTEFSTNGVSFLETLNESQLSEMILEANRTYYTLSKPLLSDNQYDILKEYIETKYPANVAITQVGAPVTRSKVELPYEMASMDKIKPDTSALSDWVKQYKGPYVLSCKLDGVSGMYSTEGDTPKLYTRGDGKVGQDVSHLIKTLKLPKHNGHVVRGEFIILKDVFNTKYRDKFANPRNLVSGIVNAKSIDEKTSDLHFVAYEVIRPVYKSSEQMRLLHELGHEVVLNRVVPSLSNALLSETLVDWRTKYDYEIDGVIVCDDHIHTRGSGNPRHAFAFKMVLSDQVAEAKVVDVVWAASKDGYLKPRVRIEPIHIGGVTIEYATGFNGKFIEENKIGVGAVITMIRSGDVIPYIKSVVFPADAGKMPDVPYIWTDTHVDVLLENKNDDPTVREKNITGFFTEIGVEGLSSGNVRRIMAAGYDTVPKIVKMEKSDFAKVDGFQQKTVDKLYDGIRDRISKATLVQLMVGSNMFGHGMGERKLGPVIEAYPDFLVSADSKAEKIRQLGTKGIHKNAEEVVDSIIPFLKFLDECGIKTKTKTSASASTAASTTAAKFDTTHPLYGKTIVMTKIRDKEIIDFLEAKGGKLGDNVKADTLALIVKSKDDVSAKTKTATDKNVPIMTPDEFKREYKI
jgi:NAD-dependent DNA ligase/DNA polymerase/3'-5' exonuclease PolX